MPFTASRPGKRFSHTAWSAISSDLQRGYNVATCTFPPRKDRTPFTSQQRREAMFASATRVAVAPLRAVRGPSVRRTSRAVSSDAAAGEKFWDKMTKLASGAKDTETAVFALG